MNQLLTEDERYMKRCLWLARKGGGDVSTNPMVGAVIVANGRVIGEGYHQCCGEAHAEVNAVRAVKSDERHLLLSSTMYVSLEPCCHHGKTPPCTDLILSEGIGRVVIAMQDPFPKVAGGGIAKLRHAGVDVVVGILEEQAKELNRRFITFHEKKRPYVILKWAETADGYIDSDRAADKPAVWMTGAAAKALVHRWRSEEDAIMVGANTILRDNPSLTVRNWFGDNPIRVTIDKHSVIDDHYSICDAAAETIIYTTDSLTDILSSLYDRGVQSLFVEGGASILRQFIDSGLFDEVRRFTADMTLSDLEGTSGGGVRAPRLMGVHLVDKVIVGNSNLFIFKQI